VKVEGRLERVEDRLVKVEGRLERVEDRLVKVESRLERVEDRLVRVETDVIELKGQVNTLNIELKDFKTDVAKGFGALQTSIERSKVWMITTGIGTVLAVAGIVGFRMH
jgi:chromosome segregation ATPase